MLALQKLPCCEVVDLDRHRPFEPPEEHRNLWPRLGNDTINGNVRIARDQNGLIIDGRHVIPYERSGFTEIPRTIEDTWLNLAADRATPLPETVLGLLESRHDLIPPEFIGKTILFLGTQRGQIGRAVVWAFYFNGHHHFGKFTLSLDKEWDPRYVVPVIPVRS